ncbi:MAG: SIR2 family protein, partial [bacterium]
LAPTGGPSPDYGRPTLPANIVFTTNFDDLLEGAYRKAGRPVNLVIGATELPFWDESRVNLVKLHGTCDRPDSLIITEQDYNTIYRSNALIVQQLNTLLATKTFLFIGYSVSDPDFNQIYDQLSIDLGRHQRRPYLLTFGVDEFTMEDLERRGYHVINLPGEGDRNTQLAEWLLTLLNAVAESTSEVVPPSKPVASRPQPTPTTPQPPKLTHRGGKMNYERGLDVLKQFAEGADWYGDFDLYEAQFRENLGDERRYGPSEQSRRDRARIVERLNALAREHLDISFNDLCMGEQPRVRRLDKAADEDIAALIQELKAIVTAANIAEREAAERLWRAVQQGRVEQGEIAATVEGLRRWAQSVQKTGLPVDAQLRAAILNLTQPTEGVDGMYNYLHFALPLLPGLLSVESEIDLNKLWAEIKGRWGKKGKSATSAKAVSQLTILLEGDLQDFTTSERDSFVFALSRIVNVPPEHIRILQVAPGSILVTLEMPEQAAQRLVSMYLAGDSTLQTLHIRKVELQQQKGDSVVVASTKIILNTGKAWALLVGVNNYDDPHIANLKVCVDDVTAIQQSLTKGYQATKLLTDATPDRLPTRANILAELSIVAQAAGEGDLLLFYFSGHGVAEAGESYLLPRDARLSALKHTAVAMHDVRELLEQSPARAKVIMLDACHSGASIGKAEPIMTPEFIQRVFEEAEGMAVLASCKQGQQSWEWRDKNRSVFTYYLLEALYGKADLDKKGFVTVSDASRYITDGVKSWAVERGVPQTPTLQYTVAGDIVLNRYSKSS